MSFDFENNGETTATLDGFIHPENFADSELLRRSRLQVRFGVLAGVAAILYAGFSLRLATTGEPVSSVPVECCRRWSRGLC